MFVTIASSDENPFGDGGYCMEHTRATIDPETLREFYEACDVSGFHPALVLQQAVDNAMRATIAAATEEVYL